MFFSLVSVRFLSQSMAFGKHFEGEIGYWARVIKSIPFTCHKVISKVDRKQRSQWQIQHEPPRSGPVFMLKVVDSLAFDTKLFNKGLSFFLLMNPESTTFSMNTGPDFRGSCWICHQERFFQSTLEITLLFSARHIRLKQFELP